MCGTGVLNMLNIANSFTNSIEKTQGNIENNFGKKKENIRISHVWQAAKFVCEDYARLA